MDVFEYLPQLIVAYDGNDKFANLIHVKKATKDNDYYCPCCGGIVKPRALESTKEQSHYYHITGKCTKESQLHFFCKNWLFEKGSKFYIDDKLFEVNDIEIEKIWSTKFGDYKPDVTVYTTSGETIYFEMFFSNRKTGDDYFCKWDDLANDVVEINIKEYMVKTDENIIPKFTYLYHDGICYSKTYKKRDLYANTIARVKHELTRQKVLNYKSRIEQLDWFWQIIINNGTREEILEVLSIMKYEDLLSCYEIIKRKQCVSYLKDDVLNMINQKVISEVRRTINLPSDDKDIYFDLECIHGRTYKAGIRLNLKTEHITYNKLHTSCEGLYDFNIIKRFPKIVFNKNVFSIEEIYINEKDVNDLKKIYNYMVNYKKKILNIEDNISNLEKDRYKIKIHNNNFTVLIKSDDNSYKVLFQDCYIQELDTSLLINKINMKLSDNRNIDFLNFLYESDEYNSFLLKIKSYKEFDIRLDIDKYEEYYRNGIRLKLYISKRKVYDEELEASIVDFNKKAKACELLIQNFIHSYSFVINLVEKINNCKNNFWKAEFSFDSNGYPMIKVDQKLFIPKKYMTFEKIYLYGFDFSNQDIIEKFEFSMRRVLDNMERCGYRVMEVCN